MRPTHRRTDTGSFAASESEQILGISIRVIRKPKEEKKSTSGFYLNIPPNVKETHVFRTSLLIPDSFLPKSSLITSQ